MATIQPLLVRVFREKADVAKVGRLFCVGHVFAPVILGFEIRSSSDMPCCQALGKAVSEVKQLQSRL